MANRVVARCTLGIIVLLLAIPGSAGADDYAAGEDPSPATKPVENVGFDAAAGVSVPSTEGRWSVWSAYQGTNGTSTAGNQAPQDRTAWVQLPLALLILLSPISCLVLFVLSLLRRFPEGLRRRFVGAIIPIPAAALLLYLLYESGISPLSNIRIDLLLIYPALLLAFLFWPALLLRYLFGRR